MGTISFSEILKESWHRSFSSASFFVLGFFIALPNILFGVFFPDTGNQTLKEWLSFVSTHPLIITLLVLTHFSLALFGKSNLIVSLDKNIKNIPTKKLFLFQKIWSPYKKSLLIDLLVLCFFLVFIFFLSLPSLITYVTTGTTRDALVILALITLLPVAIVTFFIREFSFFYFLLTPLTLTSSLENGTQFFLRFRTLCLSFGIFSLLIDILFTFSFNLVMLPIVVLCTKMTPSIPATSVLFFGSLIALSWYALFKQTLWLSFFHHLATTKKKPEVPEKTKDTLNDEASESSLI